MAVVCRLDIALYIFVPVFTPLRFVMFLKRVAVLVFPFHSFFHSLFALSLMTRFLADLSGLCLYGRFGSSDAACFASRSALSFPSISQYPGIHVIVMRSCGRSRMAPSMLSRISLMIVCPDCLRGRKSALMAAWLSENIWHELGGLLTFSSIPSASCIAASSPA